MWYLLIALGLFQIVLGKPGFGPTDQEWGRVNVRENASLFWWLHYTTAEVEKYTDKPLIIWLQGGPGSSGTGYGNFAEIGPLDVDLNPRNTTWVNHANVLFVDNPVGTGFSEVTTDDGFAQNNTQIAKDFLVLLKGFLDQLPEFKTVPLYIFCESYGGKMTPQIALQIEEARKNGEIEVNLKGIGLGDGWVSSIDILVAYAPYLLNLGQINQEGYDSILKIAQTMQSLIETENYQEAFTKWNVITTEIQNRTYGVDLYNILTKIKADEYKNYVGPIDLRRLNDIDEQQLNDLMNNQVAPALNLTKKWQMTNYDVYYALGSDFMKPVTDIVERLLNETDITVAVYNGQLDLIVNTPGTVNWVEKLNHKNKDEWNAAPRNGFSVNGYYEGYVKKAGKLALYLVDRAGHMVPADNTAAMYYILKDVTNNFEV